MVRTSDPPGVFLYGHDPNLNEALRAVFAELAGDRIYELARLADASSRAERTHSPSLLLLGLDRRHKDAGFRTELEHLLSTPRQKQPRMIGLSTHPDLLAEPLRRLLHAHNVPVVGMPFDVDDMLMLAQSRLAAVTDDATSG